MITKHWLWITSIAVICTLMFLVWEKEKTLSSGNTILLRLAPKDPRSLMQGDYMILRYALVRGLSAEGENGESGTMVVSVDGNRVASFVRMENENPQLQANEYRLQYKIRRNRVQVGTPSFFFQEGHAKYYDNARYGELRVDSSGKSVLVGLRNDKFEVIKAPE